MMRPTLFALAAQIVAPAAYAQTPASDPVEEHLRRGVELRRTGQDEVAYGAFEAAYAARAEPRTAAQLGLACQATGRWLRAEGLLREALASPQDPWIARNRAALDGAMAVVERHLATVELQGEPAGAAVRINGEDAGALPLSRPVRVLAGSVTVELRAEGYEATVRRFVASPGEQLRERVDLQRAAVLPTPAPALAPAPAPALTPPSAPPALRVLRGEPDRRALRTVGWVAASAGGAALLGGLAALLIREGAAGEYNTRCDPGDARGDCGALLEREVTARVTGWVVLPLGVALTAAGLSLALSPRGESGSRGALPCSIGVAGAHCAWRF